MAEFDLTQAEADMLIAMEKHGVDDTPVDFPGPGERVAIPLTSADHREHFVLDVVRASVKLTKATFQNRARSTVTLLRVDVEGPGHRNPDGQEVPCPHVHVYRSGYGDKWASPLPLDKYPDTSNLVAIFSSFASHCNVTKLPSVKLGLF